MSDDKVKPVKVEPKDQDDVYRAQREEIERKAQDKK